MHALTFVENEHLNINNILIQFILKKQKVSEKTNHEIISSSIKLMYTYEVQGDGTEFFWVQRFFFFRMRTNVSHIIVDEELILSNFFYSIYMYIVILLVVVKF